MGTRDDSHVVSPHDAGEGFFRQCLGFRVSVGGAQRAERPAVGEYAWEVVGTAVAFTLSPSLLTCGPNEHA